MFVVLGSVLVLRAVRSGPPPPRVAPVTGVTLVDEAALARFATAITFPTVSPQEGAPDAGPFAQLHAHLAASFPRVHATLTRETVNDLSLLYTWPGTEPALPPLVLMGHLDVVPVIPGTESAWEQPPFGGTIDAGFVWGRGTLDDKPTVIAALEAVEFLLREGFQPRRTVHLAFGHDEERGGRTGALAIRDLLQQRGLREAACVVDEGGAITRGVVPGLPGPVALVGIAEKGFVSLALEVTGAGGHSSAPPPSTSIGILAAAIARLEASPFPTRIDGGTRALLDTIAPYLSFGRRLVLSNLWLFGPLVERQLAASPATAATIRTTTAATVIRGGVKDNVLPIEATAIVNFRILPGDTVQSVTERVTRVIADPRVRVSPGEGFRVDPSPVSDAASPWFAAIDRSLRGVVGDEPLVVAPYLVMGGTDARYWSSLSKQVYRFSPFEAPADALERVHGTNERLSAASYLAGIRFYVQFLRHSNEL